MVVLALKMMSSFRSENLNWKLIIQQFLTQFAKICTSSWV